MSLNQMIFKSVLRLCVILFLTEALIMQLMPLLNLESAGWLEVLTDASLLTLFAAPIIYFWGLNPLRGEQTASTWGLGRRIQTDSSDTQSIDLSLGIVVAIFGIYVFTLESGIMLLMELFQFKQHSTKSLADALLLSLFAIPVFYILIRQIWRKRTTTGEHPIRSLKQRFLIIFIPLFILLSTLSVVIYLVQFNSKQLDRERLNAHQLLMTQNALEKVVDAGKTGLTSLLHRASLQRFLEQGDKEYAAVTREFANFLKIQKVFSKLCLIGSTGEEHFCLHSDISRYGQPISQESQQRFQHAVEKTLQLKQGEIYIFPLQQKQRNKGSKIQRELGIRYATPLFDQAGEAIGVLSLEHHSDLLTQELQSKTNPQVGTFFLLDEQGQVLFNSDQGSAMENLTWSLADKKPELWKVLEANAEGVYNPGGEYVTYSTLHPQPAPVRKDLHGDHRSPEEEQGHVHTDHAPSWKLLVLTPPLANSAEMMQYGSNLALLFLFLTPLLAGGSGVLAQATYTRHAAELARNEANIHLTATVNSLAEEIKARTAAEAGLLIANEVFQNTTQGIVVTSIDGSIRSINPAFTDITGYTAEEVIGQNMRILKSDQQDREFYQQMWSSLLKTGNWHSDMINRRKNGELYPQQGTINAVYDDSKQITHFIYIFTDTTAARASEEHLERLTNYDSLTGLPNRLLLIERLNQARSAVLQHNTQVGVLYLDLYLFKRVNDTFDFATGDAVLKTIAYRLSEAMDGKGTVGRISDDEFVLLTGELSSVDELGPITEGILQIIQRSILIGDHEIQMSANIGITLFPLDEGDADTLINNANTALNRAKQRGTNRYEFFNREMGDASANHLAKENSLRRAIENQELVLYYQPQVNIKTEQITGVEALIRWPDIHSGKMTSPLDFIPLAEETGLIIPLGIWILRTACWQGVKWQQAGYPPIRVGVNISAIQFQQSDIVQTVRDVLDETKLAPELLDLELTEGVIMSDMESTIDILHELNEMGVKLSIDDFGTGYSSLSYLKRFPVHMLKIDQSFIRGITLDADDRTITETINQLGKSLGLTVIAEGVEESDQLELLRELDCDMIQGYLFSRAVAAEEISILLKKQMRRAQSRTA